MCPFCPAQETNDSVALQLAVLQSTKCNACVSSENDSVFADRCQPFVCQTVAGSVLSVVVMAKRRGKARRKHESTAPCSSSMFDCSESSSTLSSSSSSADSSDQKGPQQSRRVASSCRKDPKHKTCRVSFGRQNGPVQRTQMPSTCCYSSSSSISSDSPKFAGCQGQKRKRPQVPATIALPKTSVLRVKRKILRTGKNGIGTSQSTYPCLMLRYQNF